MALLILKISLLLSLLLVLNSQGQDLCTTNRHRLANFWSACNNPQRPITILSFGDSMAYSDRTMSVFLMNWFTERLGTAGYSLVNYRNTLVYQTNELVTAIEPGKFWFTYHYLIFPQGAVWWENNGGGIYCDKAGIFYIAQPNGGDFTISISTNAGPWIPMLTVNAYAPSPWGCFTNVNLALDYYRLRIDGQSGTNYLIGPQLLNSQVGGVQVVFASYPGISLEQVTNVPLRIREPIFKALQPDLIIWHMKEPTDESTRQRLIDCEEWWSNSIPNTDVLYIGTPWTFVDTNSVDISSNETFRQNTIVRSVALAFDRAYVDCMYPAVSYEWLRTNGFMFDPIHLSDEGCAYLARIAWNDLGFFVLDTPRRLNLQAQEQNLVLSFGTFSNIVYTVESSQDLAAWRTLCSFPGDNLPFATNLPASDPVRAFRLRLAPKPH